MKGNGEADIDSALAARANPKPFLRWPGGKRQLLPSIRPLVPKAFVRYHELCLGGGSVFFDIRASGRECPAFLCDFNDELVRTYRAVHENPAGVVNELLTHARFHSRGHFEYVKSVDPREFEDVQVAARMIYLNKASCNGMYRVNKDGQFNSAWGKKRSVHVSTDNIHAASRALLNTNVMQGDFGCVLDYARTGDFCYIDPPYPNSFQAYTAIGFDDSDQSRLHSVCVELDKRNVMFMQSNSDCPLIRRLYSDFHHIVPVQARRSISCDGDGRGTANELLITNY